MLKLSLALSALVVFLCATNIESKADESSNTTTIILRISGQTNVGKEMAFSVADLESMPHLQFTTSTPWYDAPAVFEGVPMRDLMAKVGAKGSKIVATCLDKYTVEIPLDDMTKFGVILAYRRDGKYMPISDKGPLFIVYPYDSDPQLQSAKYYTRSAWQVASLTIE